MAGNNRTKYSLYNAISAIGLTLVNGLLGIIVTRQIISRFGSDFNGLNSTVNQIINVLLILEGGFALASNVALFAPISSGDYATANGIMKATRNKFRSIGIIFLLAGTVIAIAYSFAVNTGLSREFVFTVIMMAVVPQAVNLYFSTTYRVLLQTQQKEYVISAFTALTIGAGHIANIIMIRHGGQMWMVRFITMAFALLNSLLIVGYTRRTNSFIDLSQGAKPELIKGTGDVMAQKITGVIYTSWPIVFLSISRNGGTMLASVYAVYNSVFVMIKALLHAAIDAPRLGFGQMLTERSREEVWPVYKQYEFLAIIFTFIAMTTGAALIMPFIRLYTSGIDDINYYDLTIAILMILIGMVEMIHIPSGHLINMSGNFRISKYFQIIACAVLIVSMSVLGMLYGVYGMLVSLLVVAILLAVMEIGFIHTRFFEHKVMEFAGILVPFAIAGVAVSCFEMKFINDVSGYPMLLVYAIIVLLVNALICLAVCYISNRKLTRGIIERAAALAKSFIKQ